MRLSQIGPAVVVLMGVTGPACVGDPRPPTDQTPVDGVPGDAGDDGLVSGPDDDVVGGVVEARCPMPVAHETPPSSVVVAPTGGCDAATFLFPFLRVRDAEGRDVFAGAVTQGSLSTETTATSCIFRVRLSGLVPPDKPEGVATPPTGVDVQARLCDARWQVALPLADVEAPVLRDLFFVGDGGSQVIVPGERLLPVERRPDTPRCLADTTAVDVDGFALSLGFTLEVPHATLARTTSRAVAGEAVITFDILPR